MWPAHFIEFHSVQHLQRDDCNLETVKVKRFDRSALPDFTLNDGVRQSSDRLGSGSCVV